jgi:hypothetical protein
MLTVRVSARSQRGYISSHLSRVGILTCPLDEKRQIVYPSILQHEIWTPPQRIEGIALHIIILIGCGMPHLKQQRVPVSSVLYHSESEGRNRIRSDRYNEPKLRRVGKEIGQRKGGHQYSLAGVADLPPPPLTQSLVARLFHDFQVANLDP